MWAFPRAHARLLSPLLLSLAVVLASGCEQPPLDDVVDALGAPVPERLTGPFLPIVDLRGDVNRDGVVDLEGTADEEGEDSWTAERGAIFLANIDDDESVCDFTLSPLVLSDDALANCHDALDTKVNGDRDLADLARLRTAPWPDAPDYAVGSITVSGAAARKVRLFKKLGSRYFSVEGPARLTLNATELQRGVEVAIEANDIVRDPTEWNGYADVVFTITRAGSDESASEFRDTVRLRVAPVVMFHHLTPARHVYVSRIPYELETTRFRQDLASVLEQDTERNVQLFEFGVEDLWAQDYFEPGYMAMPAANGRQHVIQVNYRGAHVYSTDPNAPLRPAGRIVFWLRGPNMAAVQQYQPGMSRDSQTLNSFGNTEVIPPYEKDGVRYPLGRLLRGRGPDTRPDYQPDPSFTRMLEAQAVQPPVYVDTSWLDVSHVDETFSFLPANTPRGWIALVADPALARRMLLDAKERGLGTTKLFTGLSWQLERPAEQSINQVLNNPSVMDGSALAALEIDTQLSILKEETGLTDAEIIRVPFLFHEVPGGLIAFQPAMLNLLSVSPTLVIAPDPHGPLIDGKDPFKVAFEASLGAYGIRVHWSQAWSPYHLGGGQVHCATNSARVIPDVKWWEGGR